MPTSAPVRRLPLTSLAGLAITLIAGIAALGLVIGVTHANGWVRHAIRTQTAIVEVGERLSTYESAYRGYMIRMNPAFLRERAAARRDLSARLASLRRESADPVQIRNLALLRPLLVARIDEAERFIALRPGLSPAGLRALFDGSRGRLLMVAIHRRLAAMDAEEERLLVIRQRHTQWLTVGLAAGLAVAVLLVVVIAWQTIGDARLRYAELEEAHRESNAEMEARRDAESRLQQMQKVETLGQLTGGIAHDFNNMLAVVIGSLEAARRQGCHDPAATTRSVETALQGAERAAALVAQLLAFARQQPLSPSAVAVNGQIEGMASLLRSTLGEVVAVETRLDPAAWPVFVDRGQLESAILNLVVNARDAMAGAGGAGRLTIATANLDMAAVRAMVPDAAATTGYVAIAVTDTGSGMSAEVIDRAVEPFFTTKGVGKGTGLGLSQVVGFVQQSGGRVAISSRVGEGTRIDLLLPRHDGAAPLPPARVRAEPARARAGETVLVVEDEPLVRAFSAEALADLGYAVRTAADGAAALAMLRDGPLPALLFTDMAMPGLSGEELAAAAHGMHPALPLLYTTGYREEVATPHPAAPILAKPFTLHGLASQVRAAIDSPRSANV